jgi:hypothetical protein
LLPSNSATRICHLWQRGQALSLRPDRSTKPASRLAQVGNCHQEEQGACTRRAWAGWWDHTSAHLTNKNHKDENNLNSTQSQSVITHCGLGPRVKVVFVSLVGVAIDDSLAPHGNSASRSDCSDGMRALPSAAGTLTAVNQLLVEKLRGRVGT